MPRCDLRRHTAVSVTRYTDNYTVPSRAKLKARRDAHVLWESITNLLNYMLPKLTIAIHVGHIKSRLKSMNNYQHLGLYIYMLCDGIP